MNMLRHYFISNSLDDLEVFEEQLEAAGVSTPQIHVLSRNDAEVENHHHLHAVQSFMKRCWRRCLNLTRRWNWQKLDHPRPTGLSLCKKSRG